MLNFPDFDNITLGEWLSVWFNTYKMPYLKPYSLRNIEQIIRLHTPEWLKAMPITKIKLFHVDKALSEIPLGRTRTYTRQVWHSAFLKAQKLDIIDKNVITLVDSIKYAKKRGKALTIIEQQQFIDNLDGKRCKWLMLFYLYSGVRRTEATNLEWSDIDYNSGLILIKGTKTADSYRHILLSDDLKNILDMQRRQTEKEKGTRYETKHPEKVFDFSANYISQAFKKICPAHHLHDLRHTYITRCAECGVSVSVCQQVVGHSTPQMTMNVYTHVFDDFKRRELSKFTLNPTFLNKP